MQPKSKVKLPPKNDIGGQLFVCAVFILFIVVGIGLLLSGGQGLKLWWKAGELVEVRAIIVDMGIGHTETKKETGTKNRGFWRPYMYLEVPADGGVYRWKKEYRPYFSRAGAENALRPYQKGKKTTVFHHPDEPDNPHLMSLTRNVSLVWPIVSLLAGVVVTALFGCLLLALIMDCFPGSIHNFWKKITDPDEAEQGQKECEKFFSHSRERSER